MGEVRAGLRSKQGENLPESSGRAPLRRLLTREVFESKRFAFLGPRVVHIGMRPDPRQLFRDFFRRQHEVNRSGSDGAARHAVILRGLFILREGDTPLCLDGAQTQRAVRGGPR